MIRLKWGVTKIGDLGDVSWIVGYSGALFCDVDGVRNRAKLALGRGRISGQ